MPELRGQGHIRAGHWRKAGFSLSGGETFNLTVAELLAVTRMMEVPMHISLDGQWMLSYCPVGTGTLQALEEWLAWPYTVPGDVHTTFIE